MKDGLKIHWSDNDDCYICESDDYPDVIGIGDTEEESIRIYSELLEDYLIDEREGRLIKIKKVM